MPTLERLAARGLRYTNFHATALCSPTRACLLSGRNHHSVGIGALVELSMGFPGYHGMAGPDQAFLPAILRDAGYNTFAVGKWHLTPPTETSSAGPYRTWPLGRGFERYYGFMGGDTSQWFPDLVQDNTPIPPPSAPEEGYHLNPDLADHAIQMIKDAHVAAPDKPFFLYYATGAGHAPHHVEPEWVEPYRGRFDHGWDAYRGEVFARQRAAGVVPDNARLSVRDPDVPAWDDLDAESRRMFARQMEVYAGFLTQTDHTSAGSSTSSRVWASSTTPSSWRSRTTGPAPRAARPGRSTSRSSSTSCPSGSKTTSATSTGGAASTPSRTTRGAGPGRAPPRSAAGSVRPTAAGSASRASCRGRPVSRTTARCGASTPTPSTSCRRCSTRPVSRCRPPWQGWPSSRSTGRAWRRPSATPRPRRRRRPSTSRCTATAPSTTTAGGPCAPSRDRAWPRRRRGAATSGSPS